jgi:serine/threonine-protein kinase
VADAISDGRAVRWESLAALKDERSGPLLEELKVLAELADIHRKIQDGAGSDEYNSPTPQSPNRHQPSTWGSFELRSELGRGGFGTVYRARDPRLDRDVALKLVPAADAAGLERVVTEGRCLAKVRHPNVITVFGADVYDGVAGIWMDLLKGRTLQEELRDRGPVSAREAAIVGIDLCQALAAVHRAGVVHRDVKTQNVIREDGGRIVLMDFGAGHDLAAPDRPVGTPLYMAPELLEGGKASVASDLYGLGVLLFNLVTGTFPVVAEDLNNLKDAHRSGARRRLRDVRPDLPSSFIRAVERATDADPAKRPATAAVFEEDLEAVVLDSAFARTLTRLRRVPRTLVIGLVVALSLVAWNARSIKEWIWPDSTAIRSVAVLPFVNLTGSADQEYLADGMTQLLIGNLSQLRSVRVTSRTSSMAYKKTDKALSQVATELDVDGLIEGSIDRSGDRVRVTVRLLRVNEEREEHVWGQTYERPAAEMFKMQGEISGMVVDAIRLSLSEEERKHLIEGPAVGVQAQDAFLRGLHRLNDLRGENLQLALNDLNEAVRLDPSSARAYAALSQCYVLLGSREVLSFDDAYGMALKMATHAIQLDERVAEAHTQLAEAKLYYEWNWEWADREYKRALDLNPNNSHALARYSLFLSALDRHDEAISYANMAQERDPLSPTIRFAPGMALFYARRYDEAISAFQHLADLPPHSLGPSDRVGLGRSFSAVGRHSEAIAEIEAAIKQGGRLTAWLAEIGRIHALAGNPEEARRIHLELSEGPARATVRPANLAFISIALGDSTAAFEELERAIRQRSPTMLWANVDPRLDPIRNDPRFRDLIARIGLPVKR